MKKETQEALFKSFTQKQLEIIKSKQQDYADVDNDVLENFKTAGANAGISTQQQLLSLIATKVARLGNLFKGKTPNNESIDDSVIDLANYTFLLYCSLNDIDYNSLMESEPLSLGEIMRMMNNKMPNIELDKSGNKKESYALNITNSKADEPLGWPLHPNVKKHFEDTQQLINDWREGNFKDNCY